MSPSASAPGKIMLSGEYAVLEGHVAVVAAVNRRAIARLGDERSESPLILHLAALLDGAAAERALTITVDSSALFDSETKLGLGSSAAVAVAATALALGTDEPKKVLPLAFEAHARAQAERGARGSGADVAAATYGGLVAVRPAGVAPVDVTPLDLPPSLELVYVWTGVAADTAALVRAVSATRGLDKVHRAIASIAAASRALIDALRAGDSRECLAAIHRGADAHAELAAASGVDLVLPAHRQIRALAASRGGAAKPTGAGGGDVALAAFADPEAAARFRTDLALMGMKALDLAVESDGVRIH